MWFELYRFRITDLQFQNLNFFLPSHLLLITQVSVNISLCLIQIYYCLNIWCFPDPARWSWWAMWPNNVLYICAKSLSRVRLSAAPWTIAHQAPLSMGFSRQYYWSRLPFLSPGRLPDPGVEPLFPTLQADCLPSEPKMPKAPDEFISLPPCLLAFFCFICPGTGP